MNNIMCARKFRAMNNIMCARKTSTNTLGLLLFLLPAAAGEGPFPPWPPTWQLNQSTIFMPCSNTAELLPPANLTGWALASVDWSNAKAQWAAAKPMTAEELLYAQAQQNAAAFGSGIRTWVSGARKPLPLSKPGAQWARARVAASPKTSARSPNRQHPWPRRCTATR